MASGWFNEMIQYYQQTSVKVFYIRTQLAHKRGNLRLKVVFSGRDYSVLQWMT